MANLSTDMPTNIQMIDTLQGPIGNTTGCTKNTTRGLIQHAAATCDEARLSWLAVPVASSPSYPLTLLPSCSLLPHSLLPYSLTPCSLTPYPPPCPNKNARPGYERACQ
jgi:hypothetical protein